MIESVPKTKSQIALEIGMTGFQKRGRTTKVPGSHDQRSHQEDRDFPSLQVELGRTYLFHLERRE